MGGARWPFRPARGPADSPGSAGEEPLPAQPAGRHAAGLRGLRRGKAAGRPGPGGRPLQRLLAGGGRHLGRLPDPDPSLARGRAAAQQRVDGARPRCSGSCAGTRRSGFCSPMPTPRRATSAPSTRRPTGSTPGCPSRRRSTTWATEYCITTDRWPTPWARGPCGTSGANGVEVRLVPQSPKHRYITFLDRSWRSRLKVPVLPYPKKQGASG